MLQQDRYGRSSVNRDAVSCCRIMAHALSTNATSVDRPTDNLNDSTHSHRHRNTLSLLSTPSKLDNAQPRRHPERNSTPILAQASPMHAFTVRVDAAAVEQLRQVQTNVITSRNESFYSAAAILTIAGLFVALTMTASLALFVFWRKTNTVFVLQKCEQEDYANEDDDSNYVVFHHNRSVLHNVYFITNSIYLRFSPREPKLIRCFTHQI